MYIKNMSFILPVGYEDENGTVHREGKMRSSTAMDEIEIHNDERLSFSRHYHDILLLSRVIVELGTLVSVTPEIIENLYEVDFRYLQTFFQAINGGSTADLITRCPQCGEQNRIHLNDVYANIDLYAKNNK